MAGSGASHPPTTPTRPRASPRPTPPSSASSLEFDLSLDKPWEKRTAPSSGTQSPQRGRTLHRVPDRPRAISRALTRRNTEIAPADLECILRLENCESIHTRSGYDPTLLEPLPFERFRTSLSEELHRAATFDSSIAIGAFSGHKDNFEILRGRNLDNRRADLPAVFFAQISRYLDFDAYKALRLTCHSWSVAISEARSLIVPPVVMLPAEILERIFLELSPIDFNAARHTCRAWMLASLEERLLTLMLERGSWSEAVAADTELVAEQNAAKRESIVDDDWSLSKRLATECSLSPGWMGHGVTNAPATTTGLQLTSEIDFSQLKATSTTVQNGQPCGTVDCSISACGKFLLAYESCALYIYSLRQKVWNGNSQPYGGYLELLTSILFPRRVLAVSMDASSQRYAIAALLEGSVGIVCDVDPANLLASQDRVVSTKRRNQVYDGGHGLVFVPQRP